MVKLSNLNYLFIFAICVAAIPAVSFVIGIGSGSGPNMHFGAAVAQEVQQVIC